MIINQVIRSLNDLTVNSLKHDEATETNFVSTPQEGSDIEFITFINYINYAKTASQELIPMDTILSHITRPRRPPMFLN